MNSKQLNKYHKKLRDIIFDNLHSKIMKITSKNKNIKPLKSERETKRDIIINILKMILNYYKKLSIN